MPAGTSGGKLSQLREKYPNAGRSWDTDNDAILTRMFKEKKKNAAIAKHFGRKPSAIQARLAHLGLIPDFWKNKREKK